MPNISFTTTNLHLRSNPFDPPGNPDENLIAIIPKFHPVTVLGVAKGDWVRVETILKASRLEGFCMGTFLAESGGLRPAESQRGFFSNREKMFDSAESSSLKDYLTIDPPDTNTGNQVLSFKRSRRLDVSVDRLMSPELLTGYVTNPKPAFKEAGGFTYFYRHWMKLWNYRIPNGGASVKFYEDGKFVYPQVRFEDVVSAGIYGSWGPKWQRRIVEWVQPVQTFALLHPIAKRVYVLLPKSGEVIDATDFLNIAAFKRLLDTKVESIIQGCSEAQSANVDPSVMTSEASFVDLGPALILRQWNELESVRDFAEKLSSTADALGQTSITQLLDEQQVNSLIRAVLTMKAPKVDIALRKGELLDKSLALGYLLPVTQQLFQYEDGSQMPLEPGNLYRPYTTQITWVTEHKRQSSYSDSGFFGIGASNGTREWTEYIQHQKFVTKYDKVRVDIDPFSDAEEMLSKAGFENFRFDRTGDQYRTAEGEDLSNVMYRCEYDEAFRRRCAIWLPVYEQKISKGTILTKYLIVRRPHLGFRPVRSSKLFFEEELSYRTSWQGAELGELVYTVNLAPGEERTVTIETRTTRSTEEMRSTVSILDLTESTSQDLSSEIEKEARSTTEQSSSRSWSAGASGSYAGISGNASSGGDSKSSTSQFARAFEKIVKKAASNITRNTKQEVRSSTVVKTESSRTESTNIKLRNINDGRTLNLLFYRLYNQLKTGIHPEDLSFIGESGVEVVAGSGITVPQMFSADQVASAFAIFDLSSFPFDTTYSPGTKGYTATYLAYWHYVIRQFLALLQGEYFSDSSSPDSEGAMLGEPPPNLKLKIVALYLLIAPRKITSAKTEAELQVEVGSLLSSLEDILVDALQNANVGGAKTILKEKTLKVASPGLYVDSLIGLRPATEPYSEEMRAQTVLQKSADIERDLALAAYYRRLAGDVDPVNGSSALALLAGSIAEDKLIITSDSSLTTRDWQLRVDGKYVCDIDWMPGSKSTNIAIRTDMAWKDDPEAHSFELLSIATHEVAFFPVIKIDN